MKLSRSGIKFHNLCTFFDNNYCYNESENNNNYNQVSRSQMAGACGEPESF